MGGRSSKEVGSISHESEVSKWKTDAQSPETLVDKVRRERGQYLVVIEENEHEELIDAYTTVGQIPNSIQIIPGFKDAVRSLEMYNKFHSKEGKYAFLLIRKFVDSEGQEKSEVTMSSSENLNHPATFARNKELRRIERAINQGKSPYGGRRRAKTRRHRTRKSTSGKVSKRLRRKTARASASSRARSARRL
jgi:hypothetical protein